MMRKDWESDFPLFLLGTMKSLHDDFSCKENKKLEDFTSLSAKTSKYHRSAVFRVFKKIILVFLKLRNKIYQHNSSEILNNPSEKKLMEEQK